MRRRYRTVTTPLLLCLNVVAAVYDATHRGPIAYGQPPGLPTCPATAAAMRGWGVPVAADDVNDQSSLIEWTPQRITDFLDGREWQALDDVRHFPPRAIHFCLQLDNVGGDLAAGGQQSVDWVRQYSLGGAP